MSGKAVVHSLLHTMQYDGWDALPQWFRDAYESGEFVICPSSIYVRKLEARFNDWIVVDDAGEISVEFREAALTAVGQQPDDRTPDSGAASHPMKRYDFDWGYVGIEKREDEYGEWVRYKDALAFYSEALDEAYQHGKANAQAARPQSYGVSRLDLARTLKAIARDVSIMLGSAQQHTDGEAVTGYTIKTGALHRIIGELQSAGFPVTVPAAPRAKCATAMTAPQTCRSHAERIACWTTIGPCHRPAKRNRKPSAPAKPC